MSFDGTLASLIGCYRSHSAYSVCSFRTRKNYDLLCRQLEREHGGVLVQQIRKGELTRWHEEWSASGTAGARSLIVMLRILVRFGGITFEDSDCQRIATVICNMNLNRAPTRNEHMTPEQAIAIRLTARRMGLHSIALTQAIQFECGLRQHQVIGEWVPENEPGESEVFDRNQKWLPGLLWSEIASLQRGPMVTDELARIGDQLPRTGPVIVYEMTDLPYRSYNFSRTWRKVANVAGVPGTIWNMDSSRAARDAAC